MMWQKIETAPKDGKTFLASDRRYIWFGFWKVQAEGGSVRKGWAICHGEGYLFADALTHWMPLPDPPSASGAAPAQGEVKE